MNGLPYYRAYPRDFVEGTVGMPFELKGAYRLLIDLIYMQDGSLPDDARYISGLLGCSVRKWNSYRKKLISMGKIKAENEIISNFRADKELVISRTLSEKQSQNRSRPNKIKDLQSPTINHTDTYTDTKERKKRAGARAFDEWYKIYPHKIGKAAAKTAFSKAIGKADFDELKIGLQRYIETKPPDRPWCNPATWLNQERWTDQPASEGKQDGPKPTQAELLAIMRA